MEKITLSLHNTSLKKQ